MKCILSIALLGLLVWSCQKKENSTTSDSGSGYDSATITDSSVNATTTMSNDSIPLADSTTVRSAGKEADSTKTAK
ncbi:hypothetical protein [Chryseobacterium sp. C3]|uniref:hypothetical protein n=1 Tax=Chryseobacterium sp. C3 TaxID=2761532 RepID=UPI0016293581|nr:hypothetical protein [Chryseobacterium sp. C3]